MSTVEPAIAARVPSTWLTPRPARSLPVHRWFVFPHSFAPELVSWLIAELGVEQGATLLDPFCGAGTTLVEGANNGFLSVGLDLLPLAVLASKAKVARPSPSEIRKSREKAVKAARSARPRVPRSPLLRRAFTPSTYGRLAASLESAREARGICARLATLAIAPRFSSLVADGGWLRSTKAELPPRSIPDTLDEALRTMEADATEMPSRGFNQIYLGDARQLPLGDDSVDVVITSPPYPNRHDYTRVFAIELELGWELGESVKKLRYDALHSHPEARPERKLLDYDPPEELDTQVRSVAERHRDPRIPRMLAGYFNDLYLVLLELARVLRQGGAAALVVGNAQYCGVSIPVDAHLVGLAEAAGFGVEDVVPLRIRGNSAQQMAAFGRRPSRESAVLLRR